MSIPHVILEHHKKLAWTGMEMVLSCRDKLPHLGKVIWDGVLTLSKRIWLKRDADTVATEGVLFCHLGRRVPFEATVSVGVYYPSECGYFLHNL